MFGAAAENLKVDFTDTEEGAPSAATSTAITRAAGTAFIGFPAIGGAKTASASVEGGTRPSSGPYTATATVAIKPTTAAEATEALDALIGAQIFTHSKNFITYPADAAKTVTLEVFADLRIIGRYRSNIVSAFFAVQKRNILIYYFLVLHIFFIYLYFLRGFPLKNISKISNKLQPLLQKK